MEAKVRPARPLVLYQDTCRFCRGAARLIARVDRKERVALLGFGDPVAEPFMAEVPETDQERSWQLILPDGRRLMQGEAGVELMASMNGLGWLARTVRALHLTGVVGAVYRGISSVRGHFGWMFKDLPGPRRLP